MADAESEVLGLKRGDVRLVESTPLWAALYAEEEQRLRDALDRFAPEIAHCGSTSVPGLLAKPILDILVGIREPFDLPGLIEAFAPIGYVHAPHAAVPGHELFGRGEPRTHLAHVVSLHGSAWQRMLRFRDALRASPELANEYAALKRALARQHPTDRPAYTSGKTDFIMRVIGTP